jgi:hypothetical protein
MPSKVDSIGTYIFEVKESGLTTTKNGFPQWVARLKATKKYVETPEDMKHFSLDTPGYVDWSSFDEEIVAYLVLFKSKDEFSKDTALLNYEQLATCDRMGRHRVRQPHQRHDSIGKSILGRVEDNSYTNPETGKVSEGLRVSGSTRRRQPRAAVEDARRRRGQGPRREAQDHEDGEARRPGQARDERSPPPRSRRRPRLRPRPRPGGTRRSRHAGRSEAAVVEEKGRCPDAAPGRGAGPRRTTRYCR